MAGNELQKIGDDFVGEPIPVTTPDLQGFEVAREFWS